MTVACNTGSNNISPDCHKYNDNTRKNAIIWLVNETKSCVPEPLIRWVHSLNADMEVPVKKLSL